MSTGKHGVAYFLGNARLENDPCNTWRQELDLASTTTLPRLSDEQPAFALARTFTLSLLAVIPALAQNSSYSTDCEAARKALSINNPGQLAPCWANSSTASGMPALNTKQMMQMQVASTVIDAFVNMVFSNDSQANAQKQKMIAQ